MKETTLSDTECQLHDFLSNLLSIEKWDGGCNLVIPTLIMASQLKQKMYNQINFVSNLLPQRA